MKKKTPPEIGLIIPVYNEAEIVSEFHTQLTAVLNELPNRSHIYYIDDGSRDETLSIIKNIAGDDPRVHYLSLSRNFGHQAALSCGIDHAKGDVLITMDGDGQNPPELIPEMLNLFEAGYDIITAQRKPQNSVTAGFKRFSSWAFYWLINKIGNLNITPHAADFRLLSRQVAEAIKDMPEYHKFLRGMISWAGFKSVVLPFQPKPRLGGESKYTLKKMFNLAGDAIFSFSLVPLKIGLGIGGLFYLLALIEAIYVLSLWFAGKSAQLEPGWSSLMFMLLIVGGTLTTVVSFIGIYVGYIFQEVKKRPIYLVKKTSESTKNPKE
jgi:polyisoprenyl-phosphate glycosyltransferase